jgi:hypothetical protein
MGDPSTEQNLESLEKQNASLSEALRLEQTRSHRLSAKMLKLEAELARPILELMFDRLRAAGNRLTGGGLRSLGKRALENLVHWAMASPAIRALVRRVLQPWPKTSVRLSQLGSSAQSTPTKPTGNTSRSLIGKSRPTPEELTPSASSIYAKLAVAYEKRAWNDIR